MIRQQHPNFRKRLIEALALKPLIGLVERPGELLLGTSGCLLASPDTPLEVDQGQRGVIALRGLEISDRECAHLFAEDVLLERIELLAIGIEPLLSRIEQRQLALQVE